MRETILLAAFILGFNLGASAKPLPGDSDWNMPGPEISPGDDEKPPHIKTIGSSAALAQSTLFRYMDAWTLQAMQTYGSDSPKYANRLLTYAKLARDNKSFNLASSLFGGALEIFKNDGCDSSKEVLESSQGFVQICFRKREYSKAELVMKEVLTRLQKCTFQNQSITIACLKTQALACYAQSKYSEAIILYERLISLEGPENLNPEDLMSLAALYSLDNKPEQAANILTFRTRLKRSSAKLIENLTRKKIKVWNFETFNAAQE